MFSTLSFFQNQQELRVTFTYTEYASKSYPYEWQKKSYPYAELFG